MCQKQHSLCGYPMMIVETPTLDVGDVVLVSIAAFNDYVEKRTTIQELGRKTVMRRGEKQS